MPPPVARDVRRGRSRRPLAARRLVAVLGLLAVVVLGAGCSTRVVVRVDAAEDGSGTVRVTATLDKAAAERTGGVETVVRVDDLRDAGWSVEVARPDARGAVAVRAVRSFGSPADAAAVLAQLSGPEGPLPDLRLERTSYVVATRTSLRGTVDLSRGLATFGDAALQKALAGATAIGVDEAELARQLGVAPKDAFLLTVEAELPGATLRRWAVPLGSVTTVAATGTVWLVDVLLPAAVAVVAAAVLVVWWLRHRKRHDRGRRTVPRVAAAPRGGRDRRG